MRDKEYYSAARNRKRQAPPKAPRSERAAQGRDAADDPSIRIGKSEGMVRKLESEGAR